MANALGRLPESRSQREAFGETMAKLAAEQDRILVLDGDLANSTRADTVAREVPGQFLEMGISEQNMFGVAAGLATMGFIPYVSTFAAFAVAKSLDQIRVTIAQPHLNVKIAAAYSGILTGSTGKTHQILDDLAIMRAIPGMTVIAPADDVETDATLRLAADLDGPVYIRLARDPVVRVFSPPCSMVPGAPFVLRPGAEVVLVSTGTQTSRTMEACQRLIQAGFDVGLVHVPFLKPLDTASLYEAISRSRLVVTVEEHTTVGGLGGAVAEFIAETGGPRLRRIGIDDVFGESGSNDDLLERFGLSPARIVERVQAWVDGS